jgi:3-oxoadipate enol-lactonase
VISSKIIDVPGVKLKMFVELNGTRFNYRLDGPTDAPVVTLAHALANSLELWDDLADSLSSRYRVLRYDQRGHGRSSAVPGPYSFPMLEADAIGILDALGIDKANWIGLSIGGMIGYGLAINHPSRLTSLIACDSRSDAPPDYAAYFQSRIDKAHAGGMEGVVESTVERWFTPESLSAGIPVLDKVRNMIRTTNPIGHEGCCEALKKLAYGSQLSKISVPTMILGGANDKGAPPEILAEVARRIPNAQHVVIPKAGHITPLENPEMTLEAILSFLARHN